MILIVRNIQRLYLWSLLDFVTKDKSDSRMIISLVESMYNQPIRNHKVPIFGGVIYDIWLLLQGQTIVQNLSVPVCQLLLLEVHNVQSICGKS